MLTQEKLKELLTYDPETGLFVWNVRTPDIFTHGKYTAERQCKRFNASTAGKVAGNIRSDGYIRIEIFHKNYYAHQLAALYMNGVFPEDELDHVNMVRDDNRWENLRPATRAQNKRNMRVRADSHSRIKGVYFRKRSSRYEAKITVDGNHVYLGSFDCPAAASFAYQIASDKLHKQFARVS